METIIEASELDPKISSGNNRSCWTASADPLAFEKLRAEIETDVLIVGGGIAGVTTAYCLTKAGYRVTLVEDGFLGSGETGRTTAHLTCALDDRFYNLEDIYGTEKASLAAASHMKAIQWIEDVVRDEHIDCDFKRVDGYLFASETDVVATIEKEYESCKRVGLNTTILPQVPHISGEAAKQCIHFPAQGQFHVMKYLKGLADAIIAAGGNVFTETKATDINSEGAIANGFKISAKHIVVATNTPVNDFVTMHTKQWPYRTYVIAARVPKNTYPHALWWDTGDRKSKWITAPYHYVRLEAYDEKFDLLISGGEDHRTGQANDEEIPETARYTRLTEWTRIRFPAMQDVLFQWSGQVMEPVDSLAYLGRNPGDDNIYIITGDSGNGMTHGTLGALIISDLISGKKNPWEDLYSPSRITLATTGDYLHEVGNMVAQFGDWFSNGDAKQLSDLQKGEGAILSSGLKKAAAYRDEHGKVHVCSAVCPHLGGILQWNADEKTFDCPLHGSRFTTDGIVINGPATCNLEKVEKNFD